MATDIDYDELTANRDQFVVLDVRSPPEVEELGHIPGARNFPLNGMEEAMQLDEEEFSKKFGFGKPKKDGEENFVTHCMKGGRARKAGDLLASNGLSVRVYAGSFNDWKAKGGEVVPGKP